MKNANRCTYCGQFVGFAQIESGEVKYRVINKKLELEFYHRKCMCKKKYLVKYQQLNLFDQEDQL